ncbi:MAG: poly-gamma-glutamate hydrolase family protein [Pseudomonadota bacterium]
MATALVLAKTFKSFADLAGAYTEGVDYCIKRHAGLHPSIAVVAPHGGTIEPPTSQIASDIAGQEFSCYLFEGIRKSNNYKTLHLTSEYFDERKCLELIADS